MISKDNQVIIHLADEGKWLRFQNPVEILCAAEPKEVVASLAHIEKEVETKSLYAAGFLAYEAGAAFDPALCFRAGGDFPLLWFGLFKEAEPFTVPAVSGPSVALCAALRAGPPVWSPAWQSSVTAAEYKKAIQSIKSYIAQGATYQVNYSYRLRAPFSGEALPYFFQIAGRQNIPWAAFVETDRYAVCSFSPEMFFSLNGKVISSKPMKGTMPRGISRADDEKNARALYLSGKNRAENVMIVDMVRNDLGRLAARNTVAVSSLYDVEKYETVWQMTSTVRARTSAGLFQIFQALFPPASCTGAPKVNTSRIIAELETSPRRIYTGSIGFLAPGRQARFNVAIRTLLIDKRRHEAEYGVGGGIVWDSVDAAEYDECAVKAKIVCAPFPDFELLETLLWTPVENSCPPAAGYFLLDLHIARLKASAAYFSFPFNEIEIREKLAALPARRSPDSPGGRDEGGSAGEGPQRVRLLLNREGKILLEASPYQPECGQKTGQAKGMMTVGLAKRPVASDNVFLYHKTTNRTVYEEAKSSCPGYDEVILWNEKGEVTEFCAGNIVVKLGGRMITPPVACGLLPGTYRAWLLARGQASEVIIKKEDLRKAEEIYFCNSVRKMQKVKLAIGN